MKSIVGKILCDRYRIIQELNHDDFSTIYLAENLGAGNASPCRVERLQPNYDSEILGAQSWRKVRQSFVARSTKLKEISQHPQIPQLLAFLECDREFYLVSEVIPGESLQQQLQRGLIDEGTAIEWLREVLGILEFIHEAGVFHLNIQPSSLIEHQDGRKFLTDFAGIKDEILFSHHSSRKTIANEDFSPGEQQRGKADLTADIYALGKTLIYALTGHPAEFIYAKSLNPSGQLSPTSNILEADIQPELADILNKMVEDLPSRRYQSASEVLAELDFERHNVVFFPPPLLLSPQFAKTTNYPVKSKTRTNKTEVERGKQKIIWVLLLLPFIIALSIVFIGLDRNNYQGFLNYANDNYQFLLKYPQQWSYKNLEDPITGEVVVFTSPQETSSDLFLEKVFIAVEYLDDETTTLEEYGQTVVERVSQEKENDIEIYQDRKTKIDKFPARMIIYSRQSGKLNLKQMEVFTIKDDRVYIAIYIAERAKFSKFLPTAENIIDSWELE